MSEKQSPQPVSVIGLGPMGRAIAGAFLANGHPTTVWNRTATKADELVTQGATRVDTPLAALEASELTIVCVVDGDAVQGILDQVPSGSDRRTSPSTTVVNLTSEGPARTRELAIRGERLGLPYLAGSIMTPAAVMGTAATRILLSGPAEIFERHRKTLSVLGSNITHLGDDPGRAATFDVALLNLFWTSTAGLMHSFALAARQQVAATELAPHAQTMVQLLADLIPGLAGEIDAGSFSGTESASLTSITTSLEHIIHTLDETRIPSTVTRAAKEAMDAAVSAGHGTDAPTRLAEYLSRDTVG